MYVLVRYVGEEKSYIVAHTDVRNFFPHDIDDYERGKVYDVFWEGDSSTCGGFYEAKIIHMTDTEQEMRQWRGRRKEARKGARKSDMSPRKKARLEEKARGAAKKMAEKELLSTLGAGPREEHSAAESKVAQLELRVDSLKAEVEASKVLIRDQEGQITKLRSLNENLQKALCAKVLGSGPSQTNQSDLYAPSAAVADELSWEADNAAETAYSGSPSHSQATATPAPHPFHSASVPLPLPVINAVPSAAVPPPSPVRNALPSASVPPPLPVSSAVPLAPVRTSKGPSHSQATATPAPHSFHSASVPLPLPVMNAVSSVSVPPPLPVSSAVPLASVRTSKAPRKAAEELDLTAGTANETGEVHIGHGQYIDAGSWERLLTLNNDSSFCKQLAVRLWGNEVLAQRSVTGTLSNNSVSKGATKAFPPLSPAKVASMTDSFWYYLKIRGCPEEDKHKRHKRLPRYLAQKCSDLRR